jgi:hypothetical protein
MTKPGPQCPCGFHFQKFSTTKQNYLIYDQEFLGVMQGLHCWSHLLKETSIPVLVYTDHTNLQYYCDPCKIRPHIAGYLPEREQYNILLEYKPGATNHADALSCCPDYKVDRNSDNKDITVWLDKYFCKTHTCIHVADWDSLEDTLKQCIKCTQYPE